VNIRKPKVEGTLWIYNVSGDIIRLHPDILTILVKVVKKTEKVID